MEWANGVLLATTEPRTVEAVAAALESCKPATTARVCRDLTELLGRLERTSARAALVDIDGEPKKTLAELGPIVTRFPDTRFIVLSKELQNDLMLEAMQAGARHFLVKQSIASDLAGVLKRLASAGRGRAAGRGSVFTVLAGGGGSGATTLAINLANELGLKSASPALVVDMDSTYGAVASCLGLSGDYGLTDVLDHSSHIDDELVVSTALVYSPSLHVLLSPATIGSGDPAPLNYDRLDSALEAFRSAYDHTVIDAARVAPNVAAALASASKATLLVFQMNVKELAAARVILEGLMRRDVPTDGVMCLANRYHRRGWMIQMQEAEKALGRSVTPISNDFAGALRSINYGQPLAQAAPRSPLRRDLQRLAARFAKARAKARAPAGETR